MRTLFLLRHAKAVPEGGPDGDRARPLAERGARAAQAIGGWMAERGLKPRLVLCSTAVRTRQTLAQLLSSLGGSPRVLYEDDLYLAGQDALRARLGEVPARVESVLLVGHNPGLHELAVRLARPESGLLARLAAGFPTAALAVYELDDGWRALDWKSARLAAYVTPKEVARERD